MYLSLTEMIAIMIALGLSILLILITIYANYTLLHENRNLRGRIRRQSNQCRNYHSPRPF